MRIRNVTEDKNCWVYHKANAIRREQSLQYNVIVRLKRMKEITIKSHRKFFLEGAEVGPPECKSVLLDNETLSSSFIAFFVL